MPYLLPQGGRHGTRQRRTVLADSAFAFRSTCIRLFEIRSSPKGRCFSPARVHLIKSIISTLRPLVYKEIRYAFYKQRPTINALIAMLQEKGLLTPDDLETMEANREKPFEVLQAAKGQEGGRVIGSA